MLEFSDLCPGRGGSTCLGCLYVQNTKLQLHLSLTTLSKLKLFDLQTRWETSHFRPFPFWQTQEDACVSIWEQEKGSRHYWTLGNLIISGLTSQGCSCQSYCQK